jgi:hypothetical protein
MGLECITDTEFAGLMDAIAYRERTVFMQQCYSGGFIDNLCRAPHNLKTCIYTASGGAEEAYEADDNSPFPDSRENEVCPECGRFVHHGEFNYYFMSAHAGISPLGTPVNADFENPIGWCSSREAGIWAASHNSTPSAFQARDDGNVGDHWILSRIPAQEPDLAAVRIDPDYLIEGQPDTLTIRVRNLGSVQAPATITGVRVDGSTIWWTLPTPPLAANSFVDLLCPIGEYPGGGHQVEACGDLPAEVTETNEFNNCRTEPVSVLTAISITDGSLPGADRLDQNRPNPFIPGTAVTFSLARGGQAKLQVFATDGRLVRTLVDGSQPSGPQEVVWDATDESGRAVGSGIYWYRLTTGDGRLTRRMVVLAR